MPPIFALNETLDPAPLSGIILTDQCVSTQAGPEGDITRQGREAARRVVWLATRLDLGNTEASGAALSAMARPCESAK